jgi:DNA polymerase-3 subunit delta'
MLFSKIYGNEPVKTYLKRSLQQKKISNSLLFSGPQGIGKSLFAIELAKALMIPDLKDQQAINRIESFNHPDLHVLTPEGASGMHAVASLREMIRHVSLVPFEAKAKVFIIHDAERMLPTASNTLLKTLEEPSLDSYMILLTSQENQLLPTIVSRVFRLKFAPLKTKELSDYLHQHHNLALPEATRLSQLSSGSIGQALEILLHPHFEKKRFLLLQILSKEGVNNFYDLSNLLKQIETILEEMEEEQNGVLKKKAIERIFSQIAWWFRDLHLIKSGGDLEFLFFKDQMTFLNNQDLNKLPSLEHILNLLDQAKLAIDRNSKLSTVLEVFFLRLNWI